MFMRADYSIFMKTQQDLPILLGLRLKHLRIQRHWTQEELAERIGISSKYLSSIERGKENPGLSTIARIAEGLQIEPIEMFDFAHEGKSRVELQEIIQKLMKNADDDKLKIATRFFSALCG